MWSRAASFAVVIGALLTREITATGTPLHPVCGAVNVAPAIAPSARTEAFPLYHFEISCFSFAYVSNFSNCSTASAKVWLDINSTVTGNTDSIAVADVYQGSVYGTSFTFANQTLFSFRAVYPDYVSCPATYYSSSLGAVDFANRNNPNLPYVVASNPLLILPNKSFDISFRTIVPTPRAATDYNIVLIPLLDCRTNAPLVFANASAQEIGAVRLQSAYAFNWSSTAPANSGQYRLCLRVANTDGVWRAVAVLNVYDSNPSFFSSALKATTSSSATYELTFTGTRLNGARDTIAVIANDGRAACVGAGGIRSASTVNVNELVALTEKQTRASVQFKTGDSSPLSYLVCYFVAATSTWTSVPNIDTLTRAQVAALPADVIAFACSTAPYIATAVVVTTDKVVAVVVKSNVDSASVLANLAALVCITSSELYLIRTDSAGTTNTLYVQVGCDVSACNSAERQAAAVASATSTNFPGLVAISLQTFGGFLISAPPGSGSSANTANIGLIAGVVVAVVAVIGAGVGFCVVRSRRRDFTIVDAAKAEGPQIQQVSS